MGVVLQPGEHDHALRVGFRVCRPTIDLGDWVGLQETRVWSSGMLGSRREMSTTNLAVLAMHTLVKHTKCKQTDTQAAEKTHATKKESREMVAITLPVLIQVLKQGGHF